MSNISGKEKCKRLTKYIVMSLITVCCIRYIPNKLLSNQELIMIAFSVSISFALLDMISPSIVVNLQNKNKSTLSIESDEIPGGDTEEQEFSEVN